MLDEILHRRLRAPYALHFEVLRNPKNPRHTLVMLHGIGSSTRMWYDVAGTLPDDVRVIAIDLLGFGSSPDPGWVKYDAHTQANSILTTLLLHRVPFKSVIIGHSLGALVSVELARRFPLYVSSLILISPPIYKPSRGKVVATQKEDVLRGIYKILYRNPGGTERALKLARKYYVKRTGAKVPNGLNVDSFLAALEACIINQSTIDHIEDINAPITVISGSRDPLIVNKNLSTLANKKGSMRHIVVKKGGHNIVGIMKDAVVQEITQILTK